jgi:general secretion pathway protein L
MPEYLVIRLGDDRDEAASWIAVDGNGARLGPPVSGALADAVADVRGRDVIALVPATNVLTTTVDIPLRGGSRLMAALPYALEEYLAEDVDTLHFAAGPRRDSGRIPVAVVAHERMSDWLQRLAQAGLSPSRLVPENYGLARIPGTLSLLVSGEEILFNDGADNEFVLQGVKPSDALVVAGTLGDAGSVEAAREGTEPSPAHLLVYCEPADEERFRHDWLALRHELADVDVNLLPDGVLPRLAVTVAAGNGVNLLQGRYGPKTEVGAMLRPWRYAVALLLALLIAAFAGKAVDAYRLGREEAALRTQFTDLYRQIRPGDTTAVIDPVATVNSLRRSRGGPVSEAVFLPSLRVLASALREHDTATLEAVSYRAGVVDVRLSAPDVSTLDRIQKSVSSSGRFSASIQSTDQVGDRISSRIQIREAGA